MPSANNIDWSAIAAWIALERLKNRIDNYSSFNQINYMPLTGEKLSELIFYVQEHATILN